MESFKTSLDEALRHGIVFVDLRIDYAFKLIFGTPGNEDLLLRLINTILPERHITSVELTTQELMPLRPEGRRSTIDVSCTAEDGSTLIIEMQIRSQNDFNDRMVFYSSFPIINRLRRGANDSYKLTPVYMVAITDFIVPGIKPNDELINHYTIRNIRDNGIEFTDSVHYVTVELPKLPAALSEVKDRAEWILYTIKNIGTMEVMPEEYRGTYLEKIFGLSNFAAMSEMTQREYLAKFMAELDEKSRLRTAREEGLAEGREEVISAIAQRMLAEGLDDALISKYTGLTPEQIAGLRESRAI
ncbi:MAG: Rpn family recombination-promoting nuclease/putative transposase [Bacteroidales bacterium]|nr:Rpn family recombination-promoting nuclease/putative transposase [Bacteroidales bacterium]